MPAHRTLSVAPTGDDTATGDAAHPLRSIEQSLTLMRPGDTLVVRGGDYHERIRNPVLVAGTAREPIVVQAAPGERPVLHGLLWLRNASWWKITGINVQWATRNHRSEHMVKFSGGTGWSFTDAEVWDARSFAAILIAEDARQWRLAGLYVHDTHRANGSNQDHLIYVTSGDGVIERCVLAHSPNGRAVKVGPVHQSDPAVRGLVVRYTTMFDNRGPSNVQLTGPSSANRFEFDIMVGAAAHRANVTTLNLTGRDNVVANSIGFDSVAMLDRDPGLEDGGGNAVLDPAFADPAHADFHPTNPAAIAYGRYAPAATG